MFVVGVKTDESYNRLRDLISLESGFQLDEPTSLSLDSCIHARMKAIRIVSYDDYLEYIDCHPDGREELRRLVASITVNETNFFRHPDQFRALKEHVLPEIFNRKLQRGQPVEPIVSMWSAGCSTGDETYTLALLARDTLDPFYSNHIEILGTDIDECVLSEARRGAYSMRTLQYVADHHLDAYFEKVNGGYKIKDEIRRGVNFRYHNLVQTPYPRAKWEKWDIIFCRNVIIYFDRKTVIQVINNLYESLAEGGYLFLGYSESLNGIFKNLVLQDFGNVYAYRKDTKKLPAERSEKPQNDGGTRYPVPRLQLIEETLGLLAAEKYDDALENAQLLDRKYPRNAEACCVAARVYLEKGLHDEAADVAGRAIDIDPLQTHAYFIIGILCAKQKDYENAIRYLRRTLYLDDTLVMAHFQLAEIYQKQNKKDDALREYKNAVRLLEKLDPDKTLEFAGGFWPQSILEICKINIERVHDCNTG